MRRIAALIAVLLAAGVMGRAVMAQRVSGVPHVGVLAPLSREQTPKSVDDFLTGMRTLGWIDGANVSIEVRFANGDPALSSANAAAFVAEKVDVIVAFSGDSAQAARRATATIPIVMDTGGDPIRSGLVASLSHPGGNVTGLSLMLPEVAAKSLQMLKEVAPRRAWRVVGKSAVVSRFEALRSGITPLVGRDEELDLLLRRWQQAKLGEGRVVLVSGEPGIGKSRLTAALSQHIETEPHTRIRYFCSPHDQDSALYPFIGRLERAAGFARDDTDATKLDKLEALLGDRERRSLHERNLWPAPLHL